MAKFDWKGYFQPTPKRIRIWGDSLLVTFGSAGIGTSFTEPHWIAPTFFALALLGKFLSNFFKEES